MAQIAKMIDVQKTYIPVDPEAFPQNLATVYKEDDPRERIPVVPYMGHNFMPTSYGYKSFFGTNAALDIDPLMARVDHIFVFQNSSLDNILVALTEAGIYYKSGQATGAWVQGITIVPPVDPTVHYPWTYTILNNELYCYMQGTGSYYKITSQVAAPGILISSVVPNFLNMAGQMGIFRAGNRLGFWDSANSVAWSNLDDFVDFTPSVETLAGSAIFADIQGSIVTIKSHGEGFIIYATKSIVAIQKKPDMLFQWDPKVLISDAGIAYPGQAVASIPDTTQYAYTSIGLHKIEDQKATPIITEVTDFLNESLVPVSLKLIEGRHLVFELADPDLVTGSVKYSTGIAEPITFSFPGTYYEPEQIELNSTIDVCSAMNSLMKGRLSSDVGGSGPVSQPNSTPSTVYTPVWTAYLSMGGVYDAANIVWGAVPVATVDPNNIEKNHCPSTINNLASLTTSLANKRAVTGAEAYVDGNWTMQRFVAAQTALWEMQDKALEAFKQAVINRASTGTKVTGYTSEGPSVPATIDVAKIGDWPGSFSAPEFGWSQCAFWLTRTATSKLELWRRKRNDYVWGDSLRAIPREGFYWREYWGGVWTRYPTRATMAEAFKDSQWGGYKYFPLGMYELTYSANQTASLGAEPNTITGFIAYPRRVSDGYVPVDTTGYAVWTKDASEAWETPYPATVDSTASARNALGRWTRTDTMHAHNTGSEKAGVFGVDQAMCMITGWKYTDTNGVTQTVASTACDKYNPATDSLTRYVQLDYGDPNTGAVCGAPLEPITIDGITVSWPSQSVTMPASTFLLQQGSPMPVYPDYWGALVYDLHLKKWGKMKVNYKQLLDYLPVNSVNNASVPYETFGMIAGVIKGDGKIYLFDKYPADSYMTWGKVGYYRLGETSVEEVRVDFRNPSTGRITVSASLDGRSPTAGFGISKDFSAANSVAITGGYPGRWHNITVSGNYDINYMEYRGFVNGRR